MLIVANPFVLALAPVAIAAVSTLLILKTDEIPLSSLDSLDPAGWSYCREWLLGAPIENEIWSDGGLVSLTTHASGKWRSLRRQRSVQSVTLIDPDSGSPVHSTAGNEYIKVMASVYASLPAPTVGPASTLHLGLGGGTLPMLLGEPCVAIELDGDVVDMAIQHCGLDPELVNIIRGEDALRHDSLVPGPYSCVFVDVFGDDNNVPPAFVHDDFVSSIHDALTEGGLVISNFHRGSAQENLRLADAKRVYANAFGSYIEIPSRFQGNTILCARKGGLEDYVSVDLDKASHFGKKKGWAFDPLSRLQKWKVY